ncbi:hypothetical protein N7456_004265 [Penicillium angulare]|uniref:Uncharacterized protein n=1 Tax=Penicillium angulare TaxID=116970 RepID=A0A9W9FW73_9EURO|nr:hypothetical protein N7456_004265 [Penicillium angulare]
MRSFILLSMCALSLANPLRQTGGKRDLFVDIDSSLMYEHMVKACMLTQILMMNTRLVYDSHLELLDLNLLTTQAVQAGDCTVRDIQNTLLSHKIKLILTTTITFLV